MAKVSRTINVNTYIQEMTSTWFLFARMVKSGWMINTMAMPMTPITIKWSSLSEKLASYASFKDKMYS
jgi:hypothetical protein